MNSHHEHIYTIVYNMYVYYALLQALHMHNILRVCGNCMNAFTHTISREIPKLTFCVASSICVSSKLPIRGEQGVLAQCTVLTLHVGCKNTITISFYVSAKLFPLYRLKHKQSLINN